MTLLHAIPSRKLAHQVEEQLRELVLSGAYAPGARLPSERDLTQALGVSRTAVREGLHRLEALGLVAIRHGSGVYVADIGPGQAPSPDPATPPLLPPHDHKTTQPTPHELIEVRLLVEPSIAALAAERATEAEIDRLARDVDNLRADLGSAILPPSDLGFHLDLCRAAHNRSLVMVIQWVLEFYAHSGTRSELADVLDHENIYHAVRRRDGDAARALMADHLRRVRDTL